MQSVNFGESYGNFYQEQMLVVAKLNDRVWVGSGRCGRYPKCVTRLVLIVVDNLCTFARPIESRGSGPKAGPSELRSTLREVGLLGLAKQRWSSRASTPDQKTLLSPIGPLAAGRVARVSAGKGIGHSDE